MKGKLVLFIGIISAATGMGAVGAQNSSNRTAAYLAQQEEREKYARLSATVEDLLESNASYQREIAELRRELKRLKDRVEELSAQQGSDPQYKALAGSIREIDEKREADKRLILEELKKLGRASATPQIPPSPKKDGETRDRDSDSDGIPEEFSNGYWVEIKKDYTIYDIVRAYNAEGVKVTVKDVLRANPKVKPEALRVGQRIWVPDMGE